jgi:hypothetical protein
MTKYRFDEVAIAADFAREGDDIAGLEAPVLLAGYTAKPNRFDLC